MAMSAEEKAAWLSARAGKLTASRMGDAMAFRKDGKPAAERIKYQFELLAERLTGFSVPHFVTEAMEHGLENEDNAVDEYVLRTGANVYPSKFYEHPTIDGFGATPDREMDDGLMEVKCPTTPVYLGWVMAGVVPDQHKPQMAAQLLCAERDRCLFLAYDPRIKDQRMQLWSQLYVPTPEYLAEVHDAAVQFLNEVDAMFDAFVSAAA